MSEHTGVQEVAAVLREYPLTQVAQVVDDAQVEQKLIEQAVLMQVKVVLTE